MDECKMKVFHVEFAKVGLGFGGIGYLIGKIKK